MRLLLGIIFGAVLTVGGAYLYDSHNALNAATEPTTASPAQLERPLVNWDTVGRKWSVLSEQARILADRARDEWNRLAS